jgi:hypothetical protein
MSLPSSFDSLRCFEICFGSVLYADLVDLNMNHDRVMTNMNYQPHTHAGWSVTRVNIPETHSSGWIGSIDTLRHDRLVIG